jgi:hypothetical protein
MTNGNNLFIFAPLREVRCMEVNGRHMAEAYLSQINENVYCMAVQA